MASLMAIGTDPIQRPLARALRAMLSTLKGDQNFQLIQAIQPTLDAGFLIKSRGDFEWIEATVAVGIAALGIVTIVVPVNQQWDVLHIASAVDNAGGAAAGTPYIGIRPVGITLPAANGGSWQLHETQDSGIVVEQHQRGLVFEPVYVVREGDTLQATWQNLTGAGQNLWLAVLRRIRVSG